MQKEEFLWVEKYRPNTIAECALPNRMKTFLSDMVKKGEITNLMMIGGPGCGKTTSAKALCNELHMDTLVLNCSENGNIDTIRTQVREFASTVSLMGGTKCVIFDESDGLTNASQQALRNFIEEFSNNCRFIFTANFGNKIIEPLKSRTAQVDFSFTKEEKFEILKQFDKRVKEILQAEGIEFDPKVLVQVIVRYFPDMRKCLNELQRLTMSGSLDADAMKAVSNDIVREIFGFLKDKKFTDLRKWIAVNPDLDFPTLSKMMWGAVDEFVVDSSIPQFLLHTNQYQVNDSMVADKEINLMAYLTELMVDVEFR